MFFEVLMASPRPKSGQVHPPPGCQAPLLTHRVLGLRGALHAKGSFHVI